MELGYLHNILKDLQLRFGTKYSSNESYLKRQLIYLDNNEKSLIRRKVLSKNTKNNIERNI